MSTSVSVNVNAASPARENPFARARIPFRRVPGEHDVIEVSRTELPFVHTDHVVKSFLGE